LTKTWWLSAAKVLASRQGQTKLPPEETSSTGMNASLALPVVAIPVLTIGIFLMIGAIFPYPGFTPS
jgi:hypothetical protein